MKYNIELIRLIAVILITFTHTRHQLTDGIVYFIVEDLPKYGTVILSIISGYLYWNVSRAKSNLFFKKVKTLLIPFLIANLLVVIPVLLCYYLLGYNFLNRLSFDTTLFTEGVLSLNSPPINPPTYFIRDIFIVFVLLELVVRKNWYMLLILAPLFFFGKVMLRYDILIMFIIGIVVAKYKYVVSKKYLILFLTLITFLVFIYAPHYLKYIISILIFVLIIDIDIRFYPTGAYSYLLHLYHSPIIVLSFPLIAKFVSNPYLSIFTQITIAYAVTYVLFLFTRKFKFLKIMTGSR